MEGPFDIVWFAPEMQARALALCRPLPPEEIAHREKQRFGGFRIWLGPVPVPGQVGCHGMAIIRDFHGSAHFAPHKWERFHIVPLEDGLVGGNVKAECLEEEEFKSYAALHCKQEDFARERGRVLRMTGFELRVYWLVEKATRGVIWCAALLGSLACAPVVLAGWALRFPCLFVRALRLRRKFDDPVTEAIRIRGEVVETREARTS
jgi:hypothetical protein